MALRSTSRRAFDDVDDMALMVAPGCLPHQQKEMLELCEIRKDRFAILEHRRLFNPAERT